MRKHLEHFWWKSGDFVKNLMMAALFIMLFVSFLVVSSFGFWLQVKLASYLFN